MKFKGGPRGPEAEQARRQMQHEVIRHFDFIGWQHIRLPRGMTVEEGLVRYRNLPGVESVEPNNAVEAFQAIPERVQEGFAVASASPGPSDPMFRQQWGLAKIGATNAWAVTTGNSNVVVAILDSGINYHHEDLAANVWRNPGEIPGNGRDDDGNGFVDDIHGIDPIGNDSDPLDEGFVFGTQGVLYHGSALAGIIGAAGNNGRGVSGVNWSVGLMAVRIVATNGFFFVASTIQALDYVVLMKQRGINILVVNMSYGHPTFFSSQAMREAHDRVAAQGILQVAIAQNQGMNIDVMPVFPASFNLPGMISVAASDSTDNLPSWSNFGRTNVDLAAPGLGIVMVSGATTNSYHGVPGGDGTSYSAPVVAGSAALLFAANPTATADDVKAALLDTADVLPAFTNKMVSNGRLNLARAMTHPAIVSNAPPIIAVQPQSRTANEGTNASFTVTAYGRRPLSYQWQRQGEALPNGANASLSLTNLTAAQEGDYAVVVSNAFGVVASAVATLTVRTIPRLVGPTPPLLLSAVAGETMTLSVETTGALPIGYRWRHLRTNGTSANLTNFALNQHACFLTLTVGSNSAGAYTILLTNVAQPVTSIQRTNTVLALLPDTDGDGLPDAWEAAHRNATDSAVDTDLDGLTNLEEYRAGTDPQDAQSYLQVENISLASGGDAVALRFMAAANKTYTIQHRSASDTGAWSRLADITASPTNRLVEVLDTNAPPASAAGFYRLATPRAP